jgi:hypothetical protein
VAVSRVIVHNFVLFILGVQYRRRHFASWLRACCIVFVVVTFEVGMVEEGASLLRVADWLSVVAKARDSRYSETALYLHETQLGDITK